MIAGGIRHRLFNQRVSASNTPISPQNHSSIISRLSKVTQRCLYRYRASSSLNCHRQRLTANLDNFELSNIQRTYPTSLVQRQLAFKFSFTAYSPHTYLITMSGAAPPSEGPSKDTITKPFAKLDIEGHNLPPSPAPSSPRNGRKYALATELVYTEGSDQYNASSVPIYQVRLLDSALKYTFSSLSRHFQRHLVHCPATSCTSYMHAGTAH